jgi:hypothetical protein
MRPVTRPRSTSRMSVSSRHGAATRYSDDDSKTAVKVGMFLSYSLVCAHDISLFVNCFLQLCA